MEEWYFINNKKSFLDRVKLLYYYFWVSANTTRKWFRKAREGIFGENT